MAPGVSDISFECRTKTCAIFYQSPPDQEDAAADAIRTVSPGPKHIWGPSLGNGRRMTIFPLEDPKYRDSGFLTAEHEERRKRNLEALARLRREGTPEDRARIPKNLPEFPE
jgi:hypothetical protein